MIPDNRLSTELMLSDWLIQKPDTEFTRTEGYEYGPSTLYDTNSELNVALWKYFYSNNTVYMAKDGTGDIIQIDTVIGATDLSVCFNQSAQPIIAYMTNGITYLKWFDTNTQEYVVTDLGQGLSSPRVLLDIKDKKSSQSDVILFYFRNNQTLCARYQRDRFSIEYVLKSTSPHKILRVGMNKINRIQFLIEEVL